MLNKQITIVIIIAAAVVLALVLALVIVIRYGIKAVPEARNYMQISPQEAEEMMAKNDGHIVVDVRRQDEYDAGHIPGAILIPNESIGAERPAELPDTDRIILVYCRSGRRSKEAAQKLADLGYTRVYEFGGIIDWTGSIVTAEDEAFDPGGKVFVREKGGFGGDFSISFAKDGTYSYYEGVLSSYRGSGVWELKDGMLKMTETGGYDFVNYFTVNNGELLFAAAGSTNFMYIKVEDGERFVPKPEKTVSNSVLLIEAGGRGFYARFSDDPFAKDLVKKLNLGPITVEMHDFGNFDKIGSLPWTLTRRFSWRSEQSTETILFQGNRITVFCDWDYTTIATVEGTSKEEFLEAIGYGGVNVTFSLGLSE